MRLLVTGAAGFIGSNFVRLALEELPDSTIVVLDGLKYSGHLSTMRDFLDSGRVTFMQGNIDDDATVRRVYDENDFTHVVNFAAESHNDRSLGDPYGFARSNFWGPLVLYNNARGRSFERILQVSTDEVYGSIDEGEFTEESPFLPNSPYSAAKAGGDLMARAFWKTYKLPIVVTHGGNTYGPWHYPEKLIPFFVTRLIDRKKVPLYGEGHQVREWIHVMDHARGILTALQKGEPGGVYNIGDENERENIEVVNILLDELGLDDSYIKRIPDPRQGAHDARYSMNTSRIRGLGWKPVMPFEESLRATVRWFVDNERWWRDIQDDAEYREFIKAFYGRSLGEDL
ncbi:MAG TPA: dTDP-glucose 4,6-dehydratase [Fimbriimonadaceae bacterium]|nr:dTDP-glucose 4,6-dehydratase [Fimbriimonadaceae bacterium]